ncbi:structural protein [Pantoea phage vB_PagM_AAM37]|uniref:Structural protein n=1 Tax=Pantoea phage vB_PagM_AAM37 TaxID=2588093 RepID=A0A513ZYE3_9CAUD|nr:structural protein [Pantoea phage vB_PagM_AAM37]QDH45698.1 structural protein [Pantoea phage vB_PagM_AAM37]
MESFANVDVNYPDGQTNKTVVPAEIQARGFKPPVRSTDGTLEPGSNLAANHLNYILNDIYNQLQAVNLVTESGGDNINGYRKFRDGTVEAWGAGKLVNGDLNVTLPTTFPEVPADIMTTIGGTNFGNNVDVVAALSATTTTIAFRGRYVPVAGGAGGPSGANFSWRAAYHPTVAKK